MSSIFLTPIIKLLAFPINPIPTPWKNPPIPLFFPSWCGLVNIPATPLPIPLIQFLIP